MSCESVNPEKKNINGSPNSCTRITYPVKYIFMRSKNLAHRSISSEMDSTYGMWTNPKTMRACQQNCIMISGLLVVYYRTRIHTHVLACVTVNEFGMCTLFIPPSRQLLTTKFRLLMTSECTLAQPTHKQTGDTLTHAQNEFPLSLTARSTIFEK